MICRGLCACTEMWMCVLYVSFGSKVRPRTVGCVAMGSALLFIVSGGHLHLFIFVLCMCCLYLRGLSKVTPRYFGWGVFSRSVLFHFTSNVLFAFRFFMWNAVTWVLSGLALRLLAL